MKSTVSNGEYRNVPVAILTESPTNPRKRFDEKALEELAATFKTQGVLEPLLVRELEQQHYQVVIGARRLRAAKLAELETVPVRVVKLSDAEAIEAQVVENLQREDIHPLEEALGFRSLLELMDGTYTVASIAARAGKSEAYVYSRIRLTDLTPAASETWAVTVAGASGGGVLNVTSEMDGGTTLRKLSLRFPGEPAGRSSAGIVELAQFAGLSAGAKGEIRSRDVE